jgi:transposase
VVAVMIGIDPHKASHTAVAINAAEEPLGQLRVRACATQVERLLAWAQVWPERTWAVEGAGGVGHLLAQQLLSVGDAGPGRAAEAGRPGAAASYRRHRQE